MISLRKADEPDVLANNKENWTARVLAHIEAAESIPSALANRYNHPDVKASLRGEVDSKCMYCESVVDHITFLHIEHIKPKAPHRFPELTFEYSNLGLACPVCNLNKSDDYDENLPFVDPFRENPDDFFIACGTIVYAKPGNRRAKLTERKIGLNRPELLEARYERFKVLAALVDEYHRETNHLMKVAIRTEILLELDRDKPYSFCAQYFRNLVM